MTPPSYEEVRQELQRVRELLTWVQGASDEMSIRFKIAEVLRDIEAKKKQ